MNFCWYETEVILLLSDAEKTKRNFQNKFFIKKERRVLSTLRSFFEISTDAVEYNLKK